MNMAMEHFKLHRTVYDKLWFQNLVNFSSYWTKPATSMLPCPDVHHHNRGGGRSLCI